MKDRTIDYSRSDAGEAAKDIATPGKSIKPHANYEHRENYHIEEVLPKLAQAIVPDIKDPEARPTPEEYNRRTEHVTRLLGTLLGMGYGTIAGGVVGGEVLGRRPGVFDRQRALRGMIMGMVGGGTAGFGVGTAVNKVRRYVGGHQQPHQGQPVIQIVVPPNASMLNQVDDAIKAGSASVKTAAIFAGYKEAFGGGARLGSSTMGQSVGAGVGMNAGSARLGSSTMGKPLGAGAGVPNVGGARLSSSTMGKPLGAGAGINAGAARLSSSTMGKPLGAGAGLNAGAAQFSAPTAGKPLGTGVGLNAGGVRLGGATGAGSARLGTSTLGKAVGAGAGVGAKLSTPYSLGMGRTNKG